MAKFKVYGLQARNGVLHIKAFVICFIPHTVFLPTSNVHERALIKYLIWLSTKSTVYNQFFTGWKWLRNGTIVTRGKAFDALVFSRSPKITRSVFPPLAHFTFAFACDSFRSRSVWHRQSWVLDSKTSVQQFFAILLLKVKSSKSPDGLNLDKMKF